MRVGLFQLLTGPSFHQYLYLGLSGIIGFSIGDYFTFNSFKLLGPKLSSLYTTIAPCSSLFFGMMLLDEHINATGICGMMITIGGVVWLTLSKQDANEAKSKGFERNLNGILCGIAGAICQGCGLVLSKMGFQKTGEMEEIATLHAVWIRLLFAFGGAMLAAFISGNFVKNSRVVIKNENKGFMHMLAGTILGPVMGVSLALLAIQYLKVAEVQTIFALLPVFVLPLNYFVYKEKITLASVFACTMAVTGVMVLIWRDSLWT
jgi:drug/metabolite transporter (DMT)-like permease